MIQTKLRTNEITPNNNISFPFGSILAVQNQYQNLGFNRVFSKHKKRGRDLNSLLMYLLSYELTENLTSAKQVTGLILNIFELEKFEERTLTK